VEDPTAAAQRLEALRRLGVRVAIDDFGTGFSSLSYLHRLPVDILKIDRSFVGSISEEGALPAVVSAIIDLAHSLQLETIAEGIERSTQRSRLLDRRCSHGQGYLFAKPLSPADAERLLLTATVPG
jgi:sensor c-di-GMP phosphodiesterase-like protein